MEFEEEESQLTDTETHLVTVGDITRATGTELLSMLTHGHFI